MRRGARLGNLQFGKRALIKAKRETTPCICSGSQRLQGYQAGSHARFQVWIESGKTALSKIYPIAFMGN